MDRRAAVPVSDLAAASWLGEQLTRLGARVAEVVPTRYEAVARVLHRVDQGLTGSGRWADVAAYCGTTVHPLAQFRMLAGRDRRSAASRAWPDHTDPREGSLDRPTLAVLRDLLDDHTTTPETCWFALWEGYGGLPAQWRQAPVFELPGRRYHLFTGALAEIVEISIDFECAGMEFDSPDRAWLSIPGGRGSTVEDGRRRADRFRAEGCLQSPNLWWPDDRAWAVATEIDFDSTLIAGSAALVREVTLAPELEAFEVDRDDSLQYDADTVNLR